MNYIDMSKLNFVQLINIHKRFAALFEWHCKLSLTVDSDTLFKANQM